MNKFIIFKIPKTRVGKETISLFPLNGETLNPSWINRGQLIPPEIINQKVKFPDGSSHELVAFTQYQQRYPVFLEDNKHFYVAYRKENDLF